jgi:hypothetical protein
MGATSYLDDLPIMVAVVMKEGYRDPAKQGEGFWMVLAALHRTL